MLRAKSTVLIVCREPAVRQMLVGRVSAAGYDPVVAGSGRQALALIADAAVDAVICHLTGGGQAARRFVEQIREQESDACILLVGADLGADRVARLLRTGAFDYLTVPFRRLRFERALAEGLEVRRSFIHVRELSMSLQHSNEQLAQDRDRLRLWNRNLGLLNRLGYSIAGTLDAERIAFIVGPLLEEMLPFERAAIVWVHPERVWIHTPHAAPDSKDVISAGDRVREFLLARAHRAVRTLERPATPRDPFGADSPMGEAQEIIDVPLTVADQPLGVLHLARLPGEAFNQYERELMQAVSTSLALALRNAEVHSQVQKLALKDPLTGLLNRRAFSNILVRKFRETERYNTPLSLIMMDLDYFKGVNDRFGHPAGDALLKEIAHLLAQSVRAVDIVARYGGEEFAIVLPGTDLSQAMILAERVREAIARHKFVIEGVPIRLACSMGVARIPDSRLSSLEHFVSAADRALYQAKALGRNRVEAVDDAGVTQAPPHAAGETSVERLGGRC